MSRPGRGRSIRLVFEPFCRSWCLRRRATRWCRMGCSRRSRTRQAISCYTLVGHFWDFGLGDFGHLDLPVYVQLSEICAPSEVVQHHKHGAMTHGAVIPLASIAPSRWGPLDAHIKASVLEDFRIDLSCVVCRSTCLAKRHGMCVRPNQASMCWTWSSGSTVLLQLIACEGPLEPCIV